MTTQLEQARELAKQRFAAVGIDVEEALRQLDRLPVSMHCWQGDDVSGFENPEGSLTGGFRLLAIIRAKRVMPASYVPIWNRLCGLFRGRNGLIYMPSIWNQTRPSRATRSNQSTSKTGLNGRKPISSVWILTPPVFASAKRRWLYAFPCRRQYSPVLD